MLTEGQEILDGRFKVVKKLGAGAFGEIYKGKYVCAASSLIISLLVAKLDQRIGTLWGFLFRNKRTNLSGRLRRKNLNF